MCHVETCARARHGHGGSRGGSRAPGGAATTTGVAQQRHNNRRSAHDNNKRRGALGDDGEGQQRDEGDWAGVESHLES